MKLLVLLVGVFTLQASSQTLPCQVTGGTSCPTMICPNTAVIYTCNVGSYVGSTNWNVPSVGGCSGSTALTLLQGQPAPGVSCLTSSSTCGPFTVTNTPPLTNNNTYCLTSTLSVTVTSAMNGLVVSCSNYLPISPFTTTPVGNAAISVVAPPAAPNLTLSKVSSDQFTVTFTVMLEPVSTATSYNVSVNGSTLISLPASNYSTNYSVSIGNGPVLLVSFPSNGTLLYMLNFTNLINDTVYIVSVVAINCAGSNSTTITGTLRYVAPTTTTSSSSTPKGNQPSIGAPSIGAILLISVAILLMETFNCQ